MKRAITLTEEIFFSFIKLKDFIRFGQKVTDIIKSSVDIKYCFKVHLSFSNLHDFFQFHWPMINSRIGNITGPYHHHYLEPEPFWRELKRLFFSTNWHFPHFTMVPYAAFTRSNCWTNQLVRPVASCERSFNRLDESNMSNSSNRLDQQFHH